jgi:UDP-glucuronate decarboxylase
MLDLAETVIKLTNSKSKIIHEALPSDDPHRRKPQIDLAKSLLNWEPKIPLEIGLIKTIEYFKTLKIS